MQYPPLPSSPYLSVGGGLQWMITPTLGLQADLRHVRSLTTQTDDFGFKRSGNNYVNAGLVWAFGGPVASPSPLPPPSPQPELGRFAAAFGSSSGSGTVVVVGHTDRLGSAAYNQRWSQQPAEAVATTW